MIKNILFDLDDTILDFHHAEKIALTKTLHHFGIEPKEEILARYSVLNLEQWRLLEQGILTREEVKERRYKLLFNEIGVDCCAASVTKYYESLLGIGHYFISGAEEMLKELSMDYRLYLVTNGTEPVQKSRIKSAGIGRYFQDIFISQSVGFDKPDIEFFNYCFSRIEDFKKCETVIVGDSLTSDIKGGNNAGIATIWFNPKEQKNDYGVNPDYAISSLSDFPLLLKSI